MQANNEEKEKKVHKVTDGKVLCGANLSKLGRDERIFNIRKVTCQQCLDIYKKL